jgi:hypothetical protein
MPQAQLYEVHLQNQTSAKGKLSVSSSPKLRRSTLAANPANNIEDHVVLLHIRSLRIALSTR